MLFKLFMNNQRNEDIINRLIKVADTLKPEIKSFFISYPYYLQYFKNLPGDEIKIENVIIGISFTYSWMPTILKNINIQNKSEILKVLNNAKKGDGLSVSDLELLKVAFNNSLVGTSKLLHFVNPEKFAIWDSRVFRNLYKEEPYKYKLEKAETYLKYLEYLNELKFASNFEIFEKKIIKRVGYSIKPLRALELGFYHDQVEK